MQLGLTATPKRKDNVDTYRYFGEPVFIYSLKDGINDGFLTPFKFRQIETTLDTYIYTSDDTVVEGEIEAGKRYEEADFNKIIEIKEREKHRVKLFMEQIIGRGTRLYDGKDYFTIYDFVLAHYVSEGVQELDQDKLTPLLRLKYNNSIADAVADLGKPEEFGRVFTDFQKYLYQEAA